MPRSDIKESVTASEKEKESALIYFKNKLVSSSSVESFIKKNR